MKVTLYFINSDTDNGYETTFHADDDTQDKAMRALIEESFKDSASQVWPDDDSANWKTIRQLLDNNNQADLWDAWSLWKEEQAKGNDYYTANSQEIDIAVPPACEHGEELLKALQLIQKQYAWCDKDSLPPRLRKAIVQSLDDVHAAGGAK